MNLNNEKTSIRISIILIILAIMLVYKIFFDKSDYSKDLILSNTWNTYDANITWSKIENVDQISWWNIKDIQLQSLNILQLPYKYITKWPNSIYIVTLDNYNQNAKNKLMFENSGNYKLIKTPEQKLKDQLEWDEIIYINHPSRNWKLVVFIVTKWLNNRLIQVNKDDYKKHKKYIYYNLTN